MSLWFCGIRCKKCLCVWNEMGGVIGTALLNDPVKECPFCKVTEDFREGLEREITEEEYGKPMLELPKPIQYEYDVVLDSIEPNMTIQAVKVIKKRFNIGSKEAYEMIHRLPKTIYEGGPAELCSQIKQEFNGIARISIK